ncbi:bifunctional homocysteine S-methyltransferase/methylenetetrahydrofolate reductase [Alkalihalobacterium alkalicellulosilyticum]|uniref:bifunctional homocysteine S-methyltransferase/methylenetetrahydrofolate reductase n=1 Tax=Alkalihalobacterium alkalicellulosilyticum TaxID=1912214 RepID=UPI003AF057F8
MSFLDTLSSKIIIGDGAMGTLLYSQGVDYCYEELNLTKKDEIQAVHRKYIDAGANLIQTNTYAANRIKLAKYGLEDKVALINKEAFRLANEVRTPETFIAGTIGGIRGIQKQSIDMSEIKESFQEQLSSLLEEKLDCILLETFYDIEEIKESVILARTMTDIPIIAQVSLGDVGVLNNGLKVADAFQILTDLGADVVGLNCRMGPYHMIRSFEEVPISGNTFLSAFPNASLPDYRDGRFFYQSNPAYFGESAMELRKQGVRLIGGCCGTTPEHIESIAKAVAGLSPVTEKELKQPVQRRVEISFEKKNQPLEQVVRERKSIIVELDPPKKLDIEKFMVGAKELHRAGVDAITLADNSLASPRIDNMALGSLVQQQTGAKSLVHVTCRDRNLIGLQSHLMGLHTLGIHEVLAITGDPTKVGDFPGATSVYDVTSFDLISLIKQLNEGISFSGKSLGHNANFSVAAAFNPNVRHLDKAVLRLEKKISCGADYFMSQPIYSEQQIIDVYHATKHLDKPIYIGIMPLTGSRNAEFLHNEVPGIKLTDEIRQAMADCGEDKEAAKREGIAIAKSLIDTAFELFNGIYLITPFLRYDMTVELTSYIQQKVKAQEISNSRLAKEV